jgi:hypothetical protein
MRPDTIHKLMFGLFEVFMLFVSIVLLVGLFFTSPLIAFVGFIVLLYAAYYLAIKIFMN